MQGTFRKRIDKARKQLGLPAQRGLLSPDNGRVGMPRTGQIAPPQAQSIAPPQAQQMPAPPTVVAQNQQQVQPQTINVPDDRPFVNAGFATPEPRRKRKPNLAEKVVDEVQKGGVGGFMGWAKRVVNDEEKMGRILLALNSMRDEPDPNIAAMARGRIQEARESKKTQQVQNQTVKWLQEQGRNDLASLVQKNPAMSGEAIKVALKGDTGQLTETQMKEAGGLRDDLRSDLKDFQLANQGWKGIKTFYQNPGAVSDYALAVGFAKILDPGSVVREGEVAAIAKSGNITDAWKSALQNAITSGGALPQEIRDEIASLSRNLYADRAKAAQTTLKRYSTYAGKSGLSQEDIYMGSPIKMPEPLKSLGLNKKLSEIEKEKRKRGLING